MGPRTFGRGMGPPLRPKGPEQPPSHFWKGGGTLPIAPQGPQQPPSHFWRGGTPPRNALHPGPFNGFLNLWPPWAPPGPLGPGPSLGPPWAPLGPPWALPGPPWALPWACLSEIIEKEKAAFQEGCSYECSANMKPATERLASARIGEECFRRAKSENPGGDGLNPDVELGL